MSDDFLKTVHEIEILMVSGIDRTHEEIQQIVGINNGEVDDAIAYLCERRRIVAHHEDGVGYYRWSTAAERP